MQSLGIDLSTDPKKVWLCEIDWGEPAPRIVALDQATALPDPRASSVPYGERPFVRDEAGLVALLVERLAAFAPGPGRVAGFDAPFGWPVAFVDAVSNWEAGDLAGFRKRPDLRLRATDRFVQAVSGVTPLSVSVDRIGSTAMLCAEVLSRYARRLDAPRLDRARALSGVAEVYPAAALRQWSGQDGAPLRATGYKTNPALREALVRDLTGVLQPLPLREIQFVDPFDDDDFAPYDGFHGGFHGVHGGLHGGFHRSERYGAYGLPVRRETLPDPVQLPECGAAGVLVDPGFRDVLMENDDALDAFLCALVARAAALGQCHAIDRPAQADELAVRERRAASPQDQEARAERARGLQREAAEHADAEGWIHVPIAGPMSAGLGRAEREPLARGLRVAAEQPHASEPEGPHRPGGPSGPVLAA